MHFVLVPLILFNIDVFVEGILGSYEAQTGSTRGLYLAILSLAGAIAPLFMGALLSQDSHTSFAPVYIASALFLIPFLWVILVYFKDFKDSPYAGFTLRTGTRLLTKNQSMRYIFIVQLHLHFFFMWTSIYIPLYLAHAAGFTWAEIGYIIAAGLSAYVLFEYPIGIAADKLIGEKEMMAAGFFLLAISCASFAFLPAGALGLWIAAMFLSRIGASLVEATSESYFFKRTQSDDTDRISLFRTARPIASILGALAGSFALLYMEFNLLFIVLALTMISGLCFTALLRDQKALWEQ